MVNTTSWSYLLLGVVCLFSPTTTTAQLSDSFQKALDEQIVWIINQPEVISNIAVLSVANELLSDMFAMILDPGSIGCAWGTYAIGGDLSGDPDTNTLFPDIAANYWITRIYQTRSWFPSPVIKVKGSQLPEARYYSFQTYLTTDLYTTVYGAIKDDEIVTNSDGSYEIIVNGNNDNTNEIAAFPDGEDSGYFSVMFRTYLSDPDTSPAGGTDLPLVTMKNRFWPEMELPYCNDAEPTIKPDIPQNDPPEYEFSVPPTEDAVPWFLALSETSVPYPNNDIGYLSTIINPVKDYVVVIRGKAPEHVEEEEVRYWSVCKFGLPSTATNGCIYDEIATLDSNDYFTIVIAGEKPSGSGDWDFIEFGPEILGVVGLRHMLPSDTFFPNSIQAIEDTGSDDITANDLAIRTSMGDYYPETIYCQVSVFESGGPDACFN